MRARPSGSTPPPPPPEHRELRRAGRLPSLVARDLPETTLRATAFRLTMQPSTAVLTRAVVWRCEVSLGVVNPRRIDGNDGVAGSIPVEGFTRNTAEAESHAS